MSVIVPTRNEEKNIGPCLEHLRWASEVVVVDSRSTDGTRSIAEGNGATVLDFEWNGEWPKKKNWALREAPLRHEWILIVDADEWIPAELADEIAHAIQDSQKVGYYLNRKFMFMGKWLRHCGYYPSWNLRLLKRGSGEYERIADLGDTSSGDNEVHEHIIVKGEVGYLRTDMLHFAFPSVDAFVEKHNRYSNWEASVQYRSARGETATSDNRHLSRRRRLKNMSRALPCRPLMRFIYSYVIQRGFLDGKPGYYFCRLLAMYELLSVAKHYELRSQEEARRSKSVLR